ncbi:MAG: aldo/keto reductase [Acidiferrobacterales bacterium]
MTAEAQHPGGGGRIAGFATAETTRIYARSLGVQCASGHYSDFPGSGALLSSIGIGTFPGEASDAVDGHIAAIVARGVQNGINVVDTATHYRYGRSPRAVGAGLRAAFRSGMARDALYLVSKGGFLLFPAGPPADPRAWFDREIVARGLGTHAELAAGVHLLSPAYIRYQLELSCEWLGVRTLDAFLVDQPEVHIRQAGKPELLRRLEAVFAVLEEAVREGKIRHYGISTYHAFRAHTDEPEFLSLVSLLGLAQKAASRVYADERAPHHFALVQLPFNQVMLEGFARFNQMTGQGNEASILQAARQLKVYVLGSHALFKGRLATQSIDVVQQAMPEVHGAAARAIQFNRSTPGLGTTLAGLSTPEHLDDVLAVARIPPMDRSRYLAMYEQAG